jgi:hypothetical protein
MPYWVLFYFRVFTKGDEKKMIEFEKLGNDEDL